MREVFENLAEQAMVHVPGQTGLHTRAFSLEKFAELIVTECCFVGEQYAEGLFDMEHYDFVNKKIKEHFGVKE